MRTTRSGQFTIGFRRMGVDWQADIEGLIRWAQQNGFGAIDLGSDADVVGPQVIEAGLRIGSMDLPEWQGMISPDAGKRKDAVARNAEWVAACEKLGYANHFVVMLPENPNLPRAENFGYMVESFGELTSALEAHAGRIVIEGWPGPGALCCTPENYRAFFEQCPSQSMGVNYDPSHLIRMGIEPLTFLTEFGDRVYHVHGKDTEVLTENLYEFGSEQPATFAEPISFGGHHWRYTIPGHGEMRWGEGFKLLEDFGYEGCVSIELEDANFNGKPETEKFGLVQGARFLEGC